MGVGFFSSIYLYIRRGAPEAENPRFAPQSPTMKSRQRNATGCTRNVRQASTKKGFAMLPRLKTTIEIDGETAQRVEAERERIAAETGLPKVSLASVIAAVLRRGLPASPCDGAKPPMQPRRAR